MINDITCDVSRHQARKSKRGLTLAGLGGLIGNTSYKHLWPKFKTLIKENKKGEIILCDTIPFLVIIIILLVQHLELRGKYVYTTRVISSAVTNVKSNHAKDMRAETIRRATAFVNKHNGTVGIRLARAGVLHDDDQAIADEWNKLARQWRDGKRGESVPFAHCFDFSFLFAIFAVGSLQMLNGNLTTDKPTEGKSTGAATSLRGRDVVIHRVKTLLRVRGPSHVGSIGGGVCRKKKKYKSTWRGLLRRLRKKRIGEFFILFVLLCFCLNQFSLFSERLVIITERNIVNSDRCEAWRGGRKRRSARFVIIKEPKIVNSARRESSSRDGRKRRR